MQQTTKWKTEESVAFILERELAFIIKEWLKRVNLVQELTDIPLSYSDRTGYLPRLFDDLLYRLRSSRGDDQPLSINAAVAYGKLRFSQGYSVAMLAEESRILEVSTFGTLSLHLRELDQAQLL